MSRLRAWGPAGTPLDSYRGRFPANKHMLHVHLRDRDWNLAVHWYPDWRPRSHYVNIALPSEWDDGTLRFVDLDLDVVWLADGAVVLDDEDEFEEPAELAEPCEAWRSSSWDSVEEVRAMIAEGAEPFDGKLYTWRP